MNYGGRRKGVRQSLPLGERRTVKLFRGSRVPAWGYRLMWKESERRRHKLEATVKALLELVEDNEKGE